MFDFIKRALGCYRSMPLFMALIAAAALGMALISQYAFGLDPCILCLYQRWPYGFVIAFGLLGFIMSFQNKRAVSIFMGFIGITFLINSVIAFYHTGVEQHWWKSHFEGCAVPDLGSDPENIIALLQTSKAARCDEIPWSDPILNLSMANYNVVFCFGLAILAFMSARLIWNNTKTA